MNEQPRIEYIEARRVLLDALGALSQQLDAVVLVGAQAVYLRTADRLPAYQPFTTDADIVVDPSLLSDRPALASRRRRCVQRGGVRRPVGATSCVTQTLRLR
jgi:hypothetical protein